MKLEEHEIERIRNWMEMEGMSLSSFSSFLGHYDTSILEQWLGGQVITEGSRRFLLNAIAKRNAEKAPNFGTAGAKFDSGKPLSGCLFDFPRALNEVAKVATFGAKKYQRGSWQTVPDGETRYFDALARHLIARGLEDADPESGISHLAHAAWNALAVLELELRRKETGGLESTEGKL